MESLYNDMLNFALTGIINDRARHSYKNSIDRFCSWLAEKDGRTRNLEDLKNEKRILFNEYVLHLQARGLSSHTIHIYIAPIRKAFQI